MKPPRFIYHREPYDITDPKCPLEVLATAASGLYVRTENRARNTAIAQKLLQERSQ